MRNEARDATTEAGNPSDGPKVWSTPELTIVAADEAELDPAGLDSDGFAFIS